MARLNLVQLEDLGAREQELLRRAEGIGGLDFLRAVGNKPELLRPLVSLLEVISNEGVVEPRLKELAIIKAAVVQAQLYAAGVPEFRDTGWVRDEEVAALGSGQEDDGLFSALERAVLRYAELFVRAEWIPDEVIDELRRGLDDSGCVELGFVVGYHVGLGRVADALDLSENPFRGLRDWRVLME